WAARRMGAILSRLATISQDRTAARPRQAGPILHHRLLDRRSQPQRILPAAGQRVQATRCRGRETDGIRNCGWKFRGGYWPLVTSHQPLFLRLSQSSRTPAAPRVGRRKFAFRWQQRTLEAPRPGKRVALRRRAEAGIV